MSPTNYLLLSALLFTIGAVGVLVRRNAIVVFMCVELMLNASNLALVAFAKQNGNLDGQIAHNEMNAIPAARTWLTAVGHRSSCRTRRPAEQQT